MKRLDAFAALVLVLAAFSWFAWTWSRRARQLREGQEVQAALTRARHQEVQEIQNRLNTVLPEPPVPTRGHKRSCVLPAWWVHPSAVLRPPDESAGRRPEK